MRKFNYSYYFNIILLPILPLLYLYNQNSQYIYFPHIAVAGILFIIIILINNKIICTMFKSDSVAFFSCVIMVVLIFAHNSIYQLLGRYNSSLYLLLLIPFVTYILTYLYYKISKTVFVEKYSLLITLFIFIMLIINVFQLILNIKMNINKDNIIYKSNFNIEEKLLSPNVYWLLCDGMLGFEAMEKYFGEDQEELSKALDARGFNINKKAIIETGHSTSIAIPTLMCPDYYDRYMKDTYSNHEMYMQLRNISYEKLYSARFNNELILAFDKKGYSTISISINDQYFFPTTDFFYYVDAAFNPFENYYENPNLVIKSLNNKNIYQTNSTIFAHNLGNILLGGIPSKIYDKLFTNNLLTKKKPSTTYKNVDEIFYGSHEAKVNYSLANSLYDSLCSKNITEPKFVLVHNLMAHSPFYLDENGTFNEDMHNINSYPGHHRYATKVLVNFIDMILNFDPNAIIILQADHGLHDQSDKQIIEAFGNYEAAINIWNNVFSAIRVPEQYQNGQEHYAFEDPRNISRYLVNNFVGINYYYIQDEKSD